MQRRHVAQGLLSSFLWPSLARAQRPAPLQEVNQFSELVAAGSLPPVAKRVPEVPSIVKDFTGRDGFGRSGGEIAILIATERDTRLMTLYANARLIVYDETFKLHADILDTYDVRENRIFTLRLRAGHKWSDGVPFTTEDFRYFWEDVANNEALSPTGPSVELIVDGRPPEVEIIDPLTIRYSWHKPNPYFIESQARAAPLWLFRPAHYLKNFHIRYADPEEIAARAQDGGSGDWVQIHRRLDVMYANNNPDLPTLNPWRLTTAPPARRFVFERNPYYYRIDYKAFSFPTWTVPC